MIGHNSAIPGRGGAAASSPTAKPRSTSAILNRRPEPTAWIATFPALTQSKPLAKSANVTRSTSAQPIPGRSPILPQWKRISALSCPPAQTSIWSIIAKRQSLSSGGEIKYTAARDFGASRHLGAKLPTSLLNGQSTTLQRGHAHGLGKASWRGRVGKDVEIRG